MQNLPPEIIDRIVDFLPTKQDATREEKMLWNQMPEYSPGLAPYATISTYFLEAVQRRLWRSLLLINEELYYCAPNLLRWSRLSHLRKLYLRIIVDEIKEEKALRFERPYEIYILNLQFGVRLRRVFDILLDMVQHGANFELTLLDLLQYPRDRQYTDNDPEPGFDFYRSRRSRITLPRANELAMLHSVRHLSFGYWERRLDPRVYLEIAARMPDLVSLNISMDATELRYPGVLRKDRQSLADALVNYSKQTEQLSHVTLDMMSEITELSDNTAPMPNLMYPLTYDVLGSSLRVWSQRLTSFTVWGVFDEALFWPQAHEKNAAAGRPHWSNMQHFAVNLDANTPSGWWYFMPEDEPNYGEAPRDPAHDPEDMPPVFLDDDAGDDGEAGTFDWSAEREHESQAFERLEETSRTRNVPREDLVEPLFAAWARALACMPSLRSASLRFLVQYFPLGNEENKPMLDWEVAYETPMHQANKPSGDREEWHLNMDATEAVSRRLVFHNTGGWRPSKDTMDLLLATGSESWPGTSMVVLEVDNWKKIVR